MGYLFDFQHRRLPHLFSPRTIRNRDKQFALIAEDADAIVVNSLTVATETTQFLGVTPEHLLVLPFTPYAQAWWFEAPVDEILTQHSISSPYFLVCNHFWAHKDHATALRAFSLLLKRHENAHISLVLTGDPVDHRDPCHHAILVALTRELGIEDRIYSLGLIPKRDQIALMRGCHALIQPTLFEGGPGGGSVYEAVGLGVPVIVSDIPINREIDTGNVTFFKAGDAYSLAEQMIQSLKAPRPSPTQDELLKASTRRLEALGKYIVDHLAQLAA
ncbi:MAG: glycosyltransferase [Xanthomonadaceae bacterium]|nr:glycosyltransferase [Xanthomonadaceae bacterium]